MLQGNYGEHLKSTFNVQCLSLKAIFGKLSSIDVFLDLKEALDENSEERTGRNEFQPQSHMFLQS